MTNVVEQFRLKEMAEEDVYFARRDLELIDALHRRELRSLAQCATDDEEARAEAFEDRFAELHEEHKHARGSLLRAYRTLLDEIARVCKHRD